LVNSTKKAAADNPAVHKVSYTGYIYTFACREEEAGISRMEQRALFGAEAGAEGWLHSSVSIEPCRSPFIRQRLSVRYEALTLEELIGMIEGLSTEGRTFKIRYVKTQGACSYDEQRLIEKRAGAVIRGIADMKEPQQIFGILQAGGQWRFGDLSDNSSVWLKHQNKPQSYSTALSTRLARAMVNTALPYQDGELPSKTLLDPCCGMGTVIIEALSMGIQTAGSDLNPLAVKGARINLDYYGYSDVVNKRDIADASGTYDAVIVDLPYNLCSVSPREQQLEILKHARRLSLRLVIVTTEDLDELVTAAGCCIIDRCSVPKGNLIRQILLAAPL
jgi:16S rRNA G966 N2-methylase RsmD